MTTPDSPRGTHAPVLTRIDDRVGRITLDRPSALHALNLEMCRDMLRALRAWRRDRGVRAVLLDHAGERGFCAGGDIRAIVEAGLRAQEAAQDFFRTEYQLNHLMFTYEKPIVAFVDGIVMGGGVGISMPCRFRVATERTLFAMPETAIGLFPDVGGGWYLPRLPGQVGTWLALTGARLRAADCMALGIATHFVPSEQLPALKRAMVDVVSGQDPEFAASVLTTELNRFAVDPGPGTVETHRREIDRLFGFATVEEIFSALEAEGGEWARTELDGLRAKSPQALKVTLRQMREGARMASFEDEMTMEFRMASRVALLPDFAEGVRACLVDKDQAPRWNPPTLEGVSEDLLRTVFARLPPDLEWTPAG
ncbi:MAG: enoyl-CoA hydratase/isomerase family protein [Proteobacteria bacterium]|nr:enoyl-CoA hydratase/isomerase family protein [Pseudomonadota bacterium]MBW3618515.1 enoyl-CoA hydratase/isomerase family protein [Pseudomonadota bacterium]